MKPSRLALAACCLVVSGQALADNCLAPENKALDMSVAAPEMRQPETPALLCVTARDVIDRARARVQQAGATPVAPSAPPLALPPGSPASRSAVNGYVPKTEHDNTPWRFDMSQNGKRMTAEEFDAWMKAKGIRVATGKPAAAVATDPAPVDPAPVAEVPGAGMEKAKR